MAILQKMRDGTESVLGSKWSDIADVEDRVEDEKAEQPNLQCECGCGEFRVCWWNYDYVGGFCKVICAKCGEEAVLINDFA